MTDLGAPGTLPPPPPLEPPPPLPPYGDRTGPPWEQPGPAVQRFIDTMKGVLLDPATTYARMRREGGLGPPLTYALIGVVVLVLAQALWQGLLGGLMPYGMGGAEYGGGLLGTLVFLPLFATLGLFVGSGLYHLVLMLLGGQKYPYETTFRTVAYAMGSTYPISIVPICGGVIAMVWGLIVTIIGLAQMHETTTGKAAGAVLIPALVCCLIAFLIGGAAIMAALGIAAAMGSDW